MYQDITQPFNLSYWEHQQFFSKVDVLIIGAGIVGLNAALQIKKKHKLANVLVLERGILPYGASTKNAGFACFGSASEIIADIKSNNETEVLETIKMRVEGLENLKKIVGIKSMNYQNVGGYELFFDSNKFDVMQTQLPYLNMLYKNFFGVKNVWSIASNKTKKFGFNNVAGMLFNNAEGAINTGKMMDVLYKLSIAAGVKILNNMYVDNIEQNAKSVAVFVNGGFKICANKLIVTTNGFAQQLLGNVDVKPARAQVLVTSPIQNLKIKGTFHFEEGYYYFRNIDNRILFGGARNQDIAGETTTEFGITETIQSNLKHYLQNVILPNTEYKIENTWSGIMGVGNNKKPIIKAVSSNIFCAVKMGGMGVAIGSLAGKQVADLAMM